MVYLSTFTSFQMRLRTTALILMLEMAASPSWASWLPSTITSMRTSLLPREMVLSGSAIASTARFMSVVSITGCTMSNNARFISPLACGSSR